MRGGGIRGWLGVVACVVLVAGVHAQQPAPPQSDRPTFRTEIAIVELSAVVTGESDTPVTDLTRDEFEVFEDGQRRPVVSARFLTTAATRPEVLPASLAGARLDEVVTNRALADAPAFVLLLDDLNISPYDSHRAIRAGLGVLGAMPRDALVTVITSSGQGGSLLTLGRPNQGHADRVRAFRGQFVLVGAEQANPLGIATTRSSVDAPCGVGSDVLNSPDCADPTRAGRRARALRAVGQLFTRTGSRRKVLFWLTTDMGVSPLDPKGNQDAQFAALQTLLGGDVTVYAVDPRENYVAIPGPNGGMGLPDRRTGGRMRVGGADTAFQGRGGSTMDLGTDDMARVPLTQLARDTGGRFIQNANDVEKLLADVVSQNVSSYVVAYESAASRAEGRHSIEVKVKRRGTRVSARRALVVPGQSTSPPPPASTDIATARLREVIRGGVPFGTLALRVHVAPQFAGDGPTRALVTVRVDEDTATEAASIDLLMLAADDTGKVGSVERFAMSRPSSAVPWEGSVTLTLARGQYQLRVAASTPDGTRTGLLLHPIDMRPPSGDLLLGVPTLLSEDTAGVRPTLGRAFPVGHPLAFQVELAGDAVRDRTAALHARLVDASGADVRVHRPATESAGSAARLRATGVISTESLVPGAYTLVVEARRASGGRPVSHAIPVRLEAAVAGSSDTAGTARSAVSRSITPVSVAHGPLTRYPLRGPQVIRTEGEWKAFWLTLPTRQAAPDIDFSRVTLLAIVSDEAGGLPGQPRVTQVHSEPGGVVVHWTTEASAGPQAGGAEPIRPFVVVGLQGHQGRVRFEKVN